MGTTWGRDEVSGPTCKWGMIRVSRWITETGEEGGGAGSRVNRVGGISRGKSIRYTTFLSYIVM